MNTWRSAKCRRARRTKKIDTFKPYEVKPNDDIRGWCGLNKENSFLAFKELFCCAQKEILIATYQIKTSAPNKTSLVNSLISILYSKLLAGVEVKILLNQKYPLSHMRGIAWASYKRISKIGINIKFADPKKVLHSKLIIVDNKIIYIGSQNLTNTALASNIETGLIINCVSIAEHFREYYNKIWNKTATG